jgi:hypothetical protein
VERPPPDIEPKGLSLLGAIRIALFVFHFGGLAGEQRAVGTKDGWSH